MSEKQAFVMVVREKYWSEFCRRNREGRRSHSFVLRGIAPPKDASRLLFYVTKPVGQIEGYAEFIERKLGDADRLWEEYGDESVLTSKAKYKDFVKNSQRVSFVRFRELQEATKAIPLEQVLIALGVKRLGRKGFYIGKVIEGEFIKQMSGRS